MRKYKKKDESDCFEVVVPFGEGADEEGLFDDCPLCQKLKEAMKKGEVSQRLEWTEGEDD